MLTDLIGSRVEHTGVAYTRVRRIGEEPQKFFGVIRAVYKDREFLRLAVEMEDGALVPSEIGEVRMMKGEPITPSSPAHSYLRQDEESHWYVIPAAEVAHYDRLSRRIEGRHFMEAEDLFLEFESEFGRYRVDSPFDVPVEPLAFTEGY